MPFYLSQLPPNKIIDQALVCHDKAYIQSIKKTLVESVLQSKQGTALLKVGDCDKEGVNVQCRLSQEALNKLRDELGLLGIASTIITGNIPDLQGKYPVYIYATNGTPSSKVP